MFPRLLYGPPGPAWPLLKGRHKRPAEAGANKRKLCNTMKQIRSLFMLGMTVMGLCGPVSAWAQPSTAVDTKPPIIVVPDSLQGILKDLHGAPEDVKTLIVSFALIRDKYLVSQDLLLIKLNHATTASEREAIREQLQDNRQA